MKKKPLIILTGPTAVGKTKASIGLAKAVDGEIISADSMQVYRHMDIGSAKIKPEEMEGIPHHLIDVLEPDDEFHVVKFQQLAKKAMRKIWERGHIPIVTGGTASISRHCFMILILMKMKKKMHAGKNWKLMPENMEQKLCMRSLLWLIRHLLK